MLTQHLAASQQESLPCPHLANISDDDNISQVCGSDVEDTNNTSTYQQHVLAVNNLGNYFSDHVSILLLFSSSTI